MHVTGALHRMDVERRPWVTLRFGTLFRKHLPHLFLYLCVILKLTWYKSITHISKQMIFISVYPF